MAGFVNKNNTEYTGNQNPVRSLIRKLSNFGIDYGPEVIRNIRSIPPQNLQAGVNQDVSDLGITDSSLQLAFSTLSSQQTGFNLGINSDINNAESYVSARARYRQFALEDDIEDILDIICDESIVFDNSRKFGTIELNADFDSKLFDELKDVYNSIYNYFGFNNINKVWQLYRRWLVDGQIAFEIVYNSDQTEIISFVELDPAVLTPQIDLNTGEQIWYINVGNSPNNRILYDSQIVIIKYATPDSVSKISYVARLVRAFNILRIMEATRIIFAVTNASFKVQYIIPVGRVGSKQAEQTLQQAAAKHRELVDFNWDSGEIKTNGEPMLQFYKQIFMASESGSDMPQIQTIGGEGPQLNDTETLKYFRDKLRQASKIPFSRFEHDQMGGGNYTQSTEGITRDEMKFQKFIDRLRTTFQEILIKPVYIQMCLNHKELMTDYEFKNNLYIKFASDDEFSKSKELENQDKWVQTVANMFGSVQDIDAEGNQVPYFDLEFLIKRFGSLSEDDIKLNDDIKKRKKLEKKYKKSDVDKIMSGEMKEEDAKPIKKKEDEEGGEGDDGGGAPPPPAGGLGGL